MQVASLVKAGCGDPVDGRGTPKFTSCAANGADCTRAVTTDPTSATQVGWRIGASVRRKGPCAMPCGCDRRLQSATRRDLVIEACVRIISSCGDQSLGETPGPIPNPEAKAWHGDGTALERVWESSTSPHLNFLNPELSVAPRDFSLCDSCKSNYVRRRIRQSLIAALRQRKPPTEQCRRIWRCCYERALMGTVLPKTHYHRWRSSMGLALTTV